MNVHRHIFIYEIHSPIYYFHCCLVAKSCPTLLCPYGLYATRLLCPWDSPGKNTGVGCRFLLQDLFLTQELNLSLLHWQMESIPLSHHASMYIYIHTHRNMNLKGERIKIQIELTVYFFMPLWIIFNFLREFHCTSGTTEFKFKGLCDLASGQLSELIF